MNPNPDTPEYSFTIEPIDEQDKKIVLANSMSFVKGATIIFSGVIIAMMLAIFFFGYNKEDLVIILLILVSILFLLLLIPLLMFLQVKKRLKNTCKIVETGTVTKQVKKEDDIGETVYSYMGTEIYASLPGNIKVGDRISIEHILNKKNKKSLFIKVEKL